MHFVMQLLFRFLFYSHYYHKDIEITHSQSFVDLLQVSNLILLHSGFCFILYAALTLQS